MTHTLIDTRHAFDAGLCGYDGPRSPMEDGEGVIITGRRAGFNNPPEAMLTGSNGDVELTGRAEIEQAIKALQSLLA